MHVPAPYVKSYTVFFFDGQRFYSDIHSLIEDLFPHRSRFCLNNCIYKIDNDYHPVCTQCRQPLTNSDIYNKCIRTRHIFCHKTKKIIEQRVEVGMHIIETSVMIRDDFGETLTYNDLEILYQQLREGSPRNTTSYILHDNGHQRTERNVKKRVGCNQMKYYRSPATTNERRQYAAAFVEDYKPKIRGRRRANNMVNAWDDIRVSLIDYAKSWKSMRHRKQWMVNLDHESNIDRSVNH